MSGTSTFLPEEYVNRKKQAVTNVICLALFAVVMFGTFVAFLVTTRRSADVERQKVAIDARYAEAAVQIEELRQLQEQKALMLERAELAAALVERVPRSILLAELINRMPAQVSLLEFELESEKLRTIQRTDAADQPTSGSGRLPPPPGPPRAGGRGPAPGSGPIGRGPGRRRRSGPVAATAVIPPRPGSGRGGSRGRSDPGR